MKSIRARLPVGLALASALVLAGAASAQINQAKTLGEELDPTCTSLDATANNALDGETLETVEPLAGEPPNLRTPCDSKLTPVERPSDSWEQIAGASFTGDESINLVAESATSFADDFYAVSFRNHQNGFFGGSTCREPLPNGLQAGQLAGSQGAELRAFVADCDRVPVIYRYTNFDNEGVVIEEAWRGDPANDPGGFVGAIGWVDANTALAVGGSGTYPRQETTTPTTPESDPARDARVWEFTQDPTTHEGQWRELRDLSDGTQDDEIPDEMRGLNALAVWPGGDYLADGNFLEEGSLAYAGGFRQLWEWRRGEGFVKKLSQTSSNGELDGASSFRFRIRGINFQPWPLDVLTPFYSFPYAVTAGCCAQNPAHNFPRVLASREPDHWFVADLDSELDVGAPAPESLFGLGANGPTVVTPDGPPLEGTTAERSSMPAMVRDPTGARNDPTGIADPNIPDSVGTVGEVPQPGDLYPREGPGIRTGRPKDIFSRVSDARALTSDVRLVALDDWRSQPTCNADQSNCSYFSFIAYAMAVGSFSSGQAALQEFNSKESPSVASSPISTITDSGELLNKSSTYKLSSYGLNSVDAMDFGGIAFAAGDHGALLRFGDQSPVTMSEPPPPRLGRRTPSDLPDRTPYGRTHEAAGSIGNLPSIADTEIERLSKPEFVPSAPTDLGFNGVNWLVMSRDGMEGFAFTDRGLYRYDGLLWESCRAQGALAHPACKGLPGGSSIATRVPLEHDADPTNDDEFEVAALADDSLYRYNHERSGRWQKETGTGFPAKAFTSIAFNTPGDGWAVRGPGPVSNIGSQWQQQWPTIYRFNGTEWIDCSPIRNAVSGSVSRTSTRMKCSDWNDRLPYGTAESTNRSMGVLSSDGRLYLYGTRAPADPSGSTDPGGRHYPLILYRDGGQPCDEPGDSGCWRSDGGGWDPGFGDPADAPRGRVQTLSVARGHEGYQGWATGEFEQRAKLARLDADGTFTPWEEPAGGPISDYGISTHPARIAHLEEDAAFAVSARNEGDSGLGPLLTFNAERERWELIPLPFPTAAYSNAAVPRARARGVADSTPLSYPKALAPDSHGGLWVASEGHFYHYTDRVPKPVFEEAPHPIRERATAAGAGLDGSFWVATASNAIYRYDRLGGWERALINGWDSGRFQTSPSPVNALAIGPDGSGVAVGPGGRIAQLSANAVRLDDAAGVPCSANTFEPPCGTSRDLVAAAVAPDGSAMVGGESRTLLWRPSGREFRLISPPEAGHSVTFTSISMPSADRVYVATDSGGVFSGTRLAQGWSWRLENADDSGDLLTRINARQAAPVRSVAVDAVGHGYAVADGILLERLPGNDPTPWRRLDVGYDVSAVAISPSPGTADLLAGEGGLLLTRKGEAISISRVADPWEPTSIRAAPLGRTAVVGLALLPGFEDGQVEAWAALSRGGRSVILHHAGPGAESLLGAGPRATPIADTPAPREGEVVFAAFGKSDCPQSAVETPCSETHGSGYASQLFPQLIATEIMESATRPGGPQFALFTGDINDGTRNPDEGVRGGGYAVAPPGLSSVKQSRWRELVADPLIDAGVPLFGAIGGRDLSTSEACASFPATCRGTREAGGLGPNLAWRAAMSPMPSPWGLAEPAEVGPLSFEPVENPLAVDAGETVAEADLAGNALDDARDGVARELPPAPHPNIDGFYGIARDAAEGQLRSVDRSVPRQSGVQSTLGGARSHYAFDLVETSTGEKRARIVVVDTSARSLAASDPLQHPAEPRGQAGWLEEVLCIEGGSEDTGSSVGDCTREPGEPAIVLSNTPTYSYGPGYLAPQESFTIFNPTGPRGGDTQPDATAFEAILMRHGVSVVVSGRIGWNALYWALAPGLHEPCPGGAYPDPSSPPKGGARLCGTNTGSEPEDAPGEAVEGLSESGAPIPPLARDTLGTGVAGGSAIPFVISSSAGGVLADASGDASEGFWRGYALIRIAADGDPAKTIVEQRPILDWVSLTASDHAVEPKQRLILQGTGREAATLDGSFRYDDIDTPAITHRYELVLADPERPWLPCEADDEGCRALASKLSEASRSFDSAAASGSGAAQDDNCGPYVCLPENVGAVDDQTGEVRAGDGKYPDTFAIALLSVGDHSATWPLVFKRSPSFIVNPALVAPAVPNPPAETGTAGAPPPPPNPSVPNVPQPGTPNVPPPPPVPPISANEPPEPQPPTPPAPPPPTEQPSPLNLALAPPAITIATPTAVIQPPTPPVNPAPPGGARREARQRQAAAQKSGADNDEGAGDNSGDLAQRPDDATAAMVRRDRAKAKPSFTALARSDQPSAWAQGALYTGGIALAAFALAAGWSRGRPTPRRHAPEVPAPAHARVRSRG